MIYNVFTKEELFKCAYELPVKVIDVLYDNS